jgi:hypothetical protein
LAEDFVMNFRNAQFTAEGKIVCEIEHPVYGWIPFGADPNDVEPIGAEVFNAAKGSAAPYVAPPEPTPAEIEARLASEARAIRNRLLTASDWTQVADAPVDQAAWAAYRQALRDVPSQPGFPATIDWPVAPS